MDRKFYYYGKLVTTTVMEELQDAIEEADLRIVSELLDWGMLDGGHFTAKTPPTWHITVAAGHGFNIVGQWLGWDESVDINCSKDYNNESVLPSFGYRKCAIYVHFSRGNDPIEMDYFENSVYYGRPEDVIFSVVRGEANPVEQDATIPADPFGEGILLGYFTVWWGQIHLTDFDLHNEVMRMATTLPGLEAEFDAHVSDSTVNETVHGAKQGSGNLFNADKVDGSHAADFAPVAHVSQQTPVHGIARGHLAGFDADTVDGFHANELRGGLAPWNYHHPGGGDTIIIIDRDETIINAPGGVVQVGDDPVLVKEVVRCMQVEPRDDGPVPNGDVGGIMLTCAVIVTNVLSGVTTAIFSLKIFDLAGNKKSETSFMSELYSGKQVIEAEKIYLNPNDYEKDEYYSFELSACTNAGTCTVDEWTVSQRTNRGSSGATDLWRSIGQDTFIATCDAKHANSLEFDIGLHTEDTTEPMVGAKVRARTFPTGGVPEAGVHIETSDELTLGSIVAGSVNRSELHFPLDSSKYTSGDRYWHALQVFVPAGQDGSLNLSYEKVTRQEMPVMPV